MIDIELRRQLAAAALGGWPVSAVVTLRVEPGSPRPAPVETARVVARLVERVARETSATDAIDYNVFGLVPRFAVRASASLLERLLAEPEVEGAVANERPADDTYDASM